MYSPSIINTMYYENNHEIYANYIWTKKLRDIESPTNKKVR